MSLNRTICPRCKDNLLKSNPAQNSVSRRDNKTRICSSCGTQEAFEDSRLIKPWLDTPTNMPYWDTTSAVWHAQSERMHDEESGVDKLKEAAWEDGPYGRIS